MDGSIPFAGEFIEGGAIPVVLVKLSVSKLSDFSKDVAIAFKKEYENSLEKTKERKQKTCQEL